MSEGFYFSGCVHGKGRNGTDKKSEMESFAPIGKLLSWPGLNLDSVCLVTLGKVLCFVDLSLYTI